MRFRNYFLILLSVLGVSALFILISLALDGVFKPEPLRVPEKVAGTRAARLTSQATANTTRVQGATPFEAATAVSQMVYPANVSDNKPRAVVLVRSDRFADAILATRVIHFPVDSPILYVEQNRMPEATRKELKRLDPEGNPMDSNVKTYIVGDIGPAVENEVRKLGYEFRRIRGDNPYTLSYNMDNWAATMESNYVDEVAILPIEDLEFGLPYVSWQAHMGQAILFVERNRIPTQTKRALRERWPSSAYIYLMGSENVISTKVANELARYGYVQRVPGGDPMQLSAVFAGYKDTGRLLGWWFGETPRDFGWGLAEAGHNYTIGNPADWQSLIPAAIFSHRGKHGPMLLVDSNSIPERVRSYLEMVQPTYAAANVQVFNHGWIIGSTDAVSNDVQNQVEQLMSVPVPTPEAGTRLTQKTKR